MMAGKMASKRVIYAVAKNGGMQKRDPEALSCAKDFDSS